MEEEVGSNQHCGGQDIEKILGMREHEAQELAMRVFWVDCNYCRKTCFNRPATW